MAPRNVVSPSAPERTEVRPMLKTSKQWVIPPRQKPGRKPSVTAVAKDETEGTKKALNRASQRAFRERRQEYVTELEEKVRTLEQGQGEKAVFFQQQAIRAKEEAAALKAENANLKKLVDALKRELSRYPSSDATSAANQQPSPPNLQVESSKQSTSPRYPSAASPRYPTSPRYIPGNATAASPRYAASSAPSPRYTNGPPVATTSPRYVSSSSSSHYQSPMYGPVSPYGGKYAPGGYGPPAAAVVSTGYASEVSPATASCSKPPKARPKAVGNPRCGLCTSETSCFCSEVGYEIDHSTSTLDEEEEEEHHETKKAVDMLQKAAVVVADGQQDAVPLKLRRRTNGSTAATASGMKNKVWHVSPEEPKATASLPSPASLASNSDKPALCNGNPDNCPACANDAFGKAFCNALAEDEEDEPSKDDDDDDLSLIIDLPCCGNPELCGSASCKEKEKDSKASGGESTQGRQATEDEVPCNEAWSALKSHPNIAFADLQMLADVVARRQNDEHQSKRLRRDSSVDRVSVKKEDSPESIFSERQRSVTPLHRKKRLTVNKHAVDEALQILDRGGF